MVEEAMRQCPPAPSPSTAACPRTEHRSAVLSAGLAPAR